jgi:hypothetical protein
LFDGIDFFCGFWGRGERVFGFDGGGFLLAVLEPVSRVILFATGVLALFAW